STFDDLVKSGKVGCAECYKVFRDELRTTIENIHGNAKYMGRQIKKTKSEQPDNHEAEIPKEQSELEKLRLELEMAVKEQEYEKAAVLRDRIREIENNENNA
ncbi:MAG: UvrB/UvrC motif-containing protein, partial [Clostridia bacterium]|nr:UvrB/UvrC motif-containing protein [Clostridia bacterium]